MQALDAIRGVVNKRLLQGLYRKRRGPKGFGTVRILRLLVFALAKGIAATRTLVAYLAKHQGELRALGFARVPSRRSISRWKKSHAALLEEAVVQLGDAYSRIRKLCFTCLDSTPLEDSKDPEAKVGKTTKGWFKGFKLHLCCDDQRVPLRAKVTTGNVHDSKPASGLLIASPATLADSAYHAKALKKKALEEGTVLIADENPRRGKTRKQPRPAILKKLRYVVEQANSLLKGPVMHHAWNATKGLANKTWFALSAVILVQAIAIYSLRTTGTLCMNIQEVML